MVSSTGPLSQEARLPKASEPSTVKIYKYFLIRLPILLIVLERILQQDGTRMRSYA